MNEPMNKPTSNQSQLSLSQFYSASEARIDYCLTTIRTKRYGIPNH